MAKDQFIRVTLTRVLYFFIRWFSWWLYKHQTAHSDAVHSFETFSRSSLHLLKLKSSQPRFLLDRMKSSLFCSGLHRCGSSTAPEECDIIRWKTWEECWREESPTWPGRYRFIVNRLFGRHAEASSAKRSIITSLFQKKKPCRRGTRSRPCHNLWTFSRQTGNYLKMPAPCMLVEAQKSLHLALAGVTTGWLFDAITLATVKCS